ncbi:MAG: efflux RND transporter periplasmic adaptor subunit [Flavobacteriales bacterium]|jgi:RND family efflux transporter MFP subunit|nr:efflux RND transporter periplasmic adaptor subunit [Flavobacteriales bacterium]
MKKFIILMFILSWSCQETNNTSHTTGAHNHETPSISQTIWTENLEFFVEFPALTVGEDAKFAAHFTHAKDHKPIKNGKLTVQLLSGEAKIEHSVQMSSSAGIYMPFIVPKSKGIYDLKFIFEYDDEVEEILIPKLEVFGNQDDAAHATLPHQEEGSIPFLKEQAWKMDFHVEKVSKDLIYEVIPSYGTWKHSSINEQAILANAKGVLQFSKPNLVPGAFVKKGSILFKIGSKGLSQNSVKLAYQKASIEFEKANSKYQRGKVLFENEIISKAQWETIKESYFLAKNNFETLSNDYQKGGKVVRAPFSGFIHKILEENGSFVNEGASIINMANHDGEILEVLVGQNKANKLNNLVGIAYKCNTNEWEHIFQKSGNILGINYGVSSEKPNISISAIPLEHHFVSIGSMVEAQVLVGDGKPQIVVPKSALLEDYGQFSVMVQKTGESFEKRLVKIGAINGRKVAVLEGLEEGEKVVDKGAYQVKMSAMSGKAPAHGHSH